MPEVASIDLTSLEAALDAAYTGACDVEACAVAAAGAIGEESRRAYARQTLRAASEQVARIESIQRILRGAGA